jgi:hypothetical protein
MSLPLACNLNAIPAEERDLHGQRWHTLLQSLSQLAPQEDGYRMSFPIQHETLSLMMQVVANERLCCPFLNFIIEIASASETVSLTLTGPEGTKALLQHEFGFHE